MLLTKKNCLLIRGCLILFSGKAIRKNDPTGEKPWELSPLLNTVFQRSCELDFYYFIGWFDIWLSCCHLFHFVDRYFWRNNTAGIFAILHFPQKLCSYYAMWNDVNLCMLFFVMLIVNHYCVRDQVCVTNIISFEYYPTRRITESNLF